MRRHGNPIKLLVASLTLLLIPTLLTISQNAPAQAFVPVTVQINEVQCSGTGPDWIELFNTSATTKSDISNLVVTDSVDNVWDSTHVGRIPRGTVIGPHKYFRFLRGSTAKTFPFDIGCGGESITFGRLVGLQMAVVDAVAIPPVAPNITWSRLSTGVNGWAAGVPTPGKINRAVTGGTTFDRSAWMFDPNLVKRIDLTLPEATVADFVTGNLGDTYQPASFSLTARNASGVTVKAVDSTAITIRLKKGYGSYRSFGTLEAPGKTSFKIKFNGAVPGQRLDGLKKLTLNNMVQDWSLVNEWASYTLFRSMGVDAPRVSFTSVYVNTIYWGFYLSLEPYDDVSLSWKYPRTQHLYEALWTDKYPDITFGRTYKSFEIDEGSVTERNDLQALEDALDTKTMSSPEIARVLDVKEVATTMAIENFMNHWDGYTSTKDWAPNNYYLHSTNAGKFKLLPWGTDQTFGGQVGDFAHANGILFKKCVADDWCRSLYYNAIAQVAAKAQALQLGTQGAAILNIQRAGIDADAALGRGPSFSDATGGANGITNFVAQAANDSATFLNANATGLLRLRAVKNLPKGSSLAAANLGAYSDVLGTYKYAPSLGTKLKSGRVKVTVTFTPTDLTHFQRRIGSAIILVGH